MRPSATVCELVEEVEEKVGTRCDITIISASVLFGQSARGEVSRPKATSVCGLQLLYLSLSPYATSVCCLKPLI